MSFRSAFVAAVMLSALASLPLSAQSTQPSAPSAAHDSTAAKAPAAGAATDSALVELGHAISVLAATVQNAVSEAAKNPELRRSAVRTASTAVSLAQRAIVQNTGEIERLLAEASKQLDSLAAAQTARPDSASTLCRAALACPNPAPRGRLRLHGAGAGAPIRPPAGADGALGPPRPARADVTNPPRSAGAARRACRAADRGAGKATGCE
jgi:hypothetical protein